MLIGAEMKTESLGSDIRYTGLAECDLLFLFNIHGHRASLSYPKLFRFKLNAIHMQINFIFLEYNGD